MSHRLDGLWVEEHRGESEDAPTVVLVHGSMDRAAGFARVARHLRDLHVVRYDRRGYAHSIGAGEPVGFPGHVDDLLAIVGDGPAVVAGHSFGGAVALAAATRRPDAVPAVVAFEAPLSWRPWWPPSSAGSSALSAGGEEEAAERFLRRMIGDDRWERLPERTRKERRAEGPALMAEMRSMRSGPAYDPGAVPVPVVVGLGTESVPHLQRAARELAAEVPDAELVEVEGAPHGAHLSHPTAFAGLVRRALARAGG